MASSKEKRTVLFPLVWKIHLIHGQLAISSKLKEISINRLCYLWKYVHANFWTTVANGVANPSSNHTCIQTGSANSSGISMYKCNYRTISTKIYPDCTQSRKTTHKFQGLQLWTHKKWIHSGIFRRHKIQVEESISIDKAPLAIKH